MKNKKTLSFIEASHYLNIGIFITVSVIIGAAAVFLPKPTVSEFEKRELQKFPKFSFESLFSGEFTSNLDLFFADTFPAREKFVEIAASFEELRGVRVDDVKIHNSNNGGGNNNNSSTPPPSQQVLQENSSENPKQDVEKPIQNTESITNPPVSFDNNTTTEEKPSEAPSVETPPAQTDELEVEGEQRGSVFIYKDIAMPMFWSNKAACDRYAATLAKYEEVLGETVDIYNLVIPSSIEFYLPQKYKNQGITADEKANIDYIYSQMNPGIKTVDAYPYMLDAKERGEYIYFRTDHHWTVRGAYAAYEAFCAKAGFTPVKLEAMEKHTIENFVGTLYGQTQDPVLKKNPDYVEYFIPPVQHEAFRYVKNQPFTPIASTVFASYATGGANTYSVFLHGDLPLTHIKTSANTGRKICIVKESFGNAFSPFMISHYDEVFVVDQRYFQLGLVNFIQQNGITDLLFINNIFAANTDIRINEIDRIRYQVFNPPVVEQKPVETPAEVPSENPETEVSEETAQTSNPEKPSDENPKSETDEKNEKVEDKKEKDKNKVVHIKNNDKDE